MGLITREQLKSYGTSNLGGYANVRRMICKFAVPGSSKSLDPFIFISHSHDDKDLVLATAALLETYVKDPYIDWLDEDMPPSPDANTANRLRSKIDNCARFVMLVSVKSLSSRWVPWELGYADAKKDLDKIALLPITEYDGDFAGNEYLKIYSRIAFDDNNSPVVFRPNESVGGRSLRVWLTPTRNL